MKGTCTAGGGSSEYTQKKTALAYSVPSQIRHGLLSFQFKWSILCESNSICTQKLYSHFGATSSLLGAELRGCTV